MLKSITSSSWRQYESAFRKWIQFCNTKKVCPFSSSLNTVTEFLSGVFEAGSGYSSLNTTRSALSMVLPYIEGHSIGSHPVITRLLKGIGKTRPPTPKYNYIWDPTTVLTYIKTLWPLQDLSLNDLTLRCVSLLALSTAHRVQTYAAIKLSEIVFSGTQVSIFVSAALKTSGPGRPQPCLVMKMYDEHPEWCMVTTLKEYIDRTANLRQDSCESLFISVTVPHKAVGSQTISRWIKSVLANSGIDTNIFSAHSCRHASTSLAFQRGVSIDEIRRTAGWTTNSTTFARFYNRPINTAGQLSVPISNVEHRD